VRVPLLRISPLHPKKMHQREAAIKATQMDAHVQCTVLAEIPATRPSASASRLPPVSY
jgi:hypothetical protein